MNEIVKKFLLAGNKCMSEMHLRLSRFTYSACGLQKAKKEYKHLQKQEIIIIYRNGLDIACFQNGLAYGNFKNLTTRTNFDKILRD